VRPLRPRRSKQHRDGASVVGTEEYRLLRSHRIEDRQRVIGELLPARQRVERQGIRSAHAATIEHDEATERCQPPHEARARPVLPADVEGVSYPRDPEQIRWSVTDDLVGDAVVADSRVPGLREIRHVA
jgi:hypothetical protein